ncbi:MAG: hypothetical protein QNJ31_05990 [Candidatus Caenarcaniphilales bacterium]|nr:hypothetical protein [Candidatus Caenarcaniphilales bacterium]
MSQEPSSLIGQILVALGKISNDQLKEALDKQASLSTDDKKPLGQVLLEMDYVDPNDIIEAIRVQMQMRSSEAS